MVSSPQNHPIRYLKGPAQAKQQDLAQELGGHSGVFALPEAVLVVLLQHGSLGSDPGRGSNLANVNPGFINHQAVQLGGYHSSFR